jgi:hypothetical protein
MKQHPADLQPPDEEEDDRAIRHLEEEQAASAAFWRSPEWHAAAEWAADEAVKKRFQSC